MTVDEIFLGATLRDRFIAAATCEDEAAAQILSTLPDGSEDLGGQREHAWAMLSTGVHWAARALSSVGINGTDDDPIGNSEAAFDRAQELERQLFKLSQLPGFHDEVGLIVDSVKRASYAAAELGPIPGGRLGSFSRGPSIVREVAPSQADLQEIGSSLGEAVRRFAAVGLGDLVTEASKALS